MKTFTIKVNNHVIQHMKKVKDKKHILNINNYRNWHHAISNKIKELYEDYISELIVDCPRFEKVDVTFQIYRLLNKDGSIPKTNKDKHNVIPIVSKFVYDAMTKNEKWQDDNDTVVMTETSLPAIWISKEESDHEYTIITFTEVE